MSIFRIFCDQDCGPDNAPRIQGVGTPAPLVQSQPDSHAHARTGTMASKDFKLEKDMSLKDMIKGLEVWRQRRPSASAACRDVGWKGQQAGRVPYRRHVHPLVCTTLLVLARAPRARGLRLCLPLIGAALR